MAVSASYKMIRITPRKFRLVADMIRKQPVIAAKVMLESSSKKASRAMHKLLNSAIANATNNQNLSTDELFIASLIVNEGPTLKRYRPSDHGRSHQILKRSSHVIITLDVNPMVAKPKPTKKATPLVPAKPQQQATEAKKANPTSKENKKQATTEPSTKVTKPAATVSKPKIKKTSPASKPKPTVNKQPTSKAKTTTKKGEA